MEINSLRDIENSLQKTREEFYKTTASLRSLLDKPVNLFLEAANLTKTVATDTDDERYALEVLATAFRRIIASIVLLESGLSQESVIILRNYLELMLIAVDIIYNEASLEEWKKTSRDDLIGSDRDDWYFSKSKICKRIDENKENTYPEFVRKLVLGSRGKSGRSISKEWQTISNMVVHAHSQAQVRQLFNPNGHFTLLGRTTTENYGKIFSNYQLFIVDIISLLIRIPKYRDLISKNEALLPKANKFSENYSKFIDELVDDKK